MLLLALGLALLAIQLAYWMAIGSGFRRAIARAATETETGSPPPPTVIVAARNERHQIPRLIRALAAQTLPPAAVILVDDGSSDGTADAATAAAPRGFPLQIVRLCSHRGDKKAALTEGISSVGDSTMALTDADCEPEPGWLHALAQQHEAHAPRPVVVIGYSPFRPGRGVLNRLARYETFVTGVLTTAAIGFGRPYMAVGRSLSYRRETFEAAGGFRHADVVRSGDDDLFIQQVATRRLATCVPLVGAGTRVWTDAPARWSDWLRQKRRHLSASRHYDRRAAIHLALFQGTSVALWLLPAVLGWAGAALLGSRLLVQYLVLRQAANVLKERGSLSAFLALDFLYMLYNLLVVPVALLKVRKEW